MSATPGSCCFHSQPPSAVAPKRLGCFGGSFDPVHSGHLSLAQKAIQQAHLDCLLLIPARRNPHKTNPPKVTPEQRLAMLRCAIAGDARLRVWAGELMAPAPSYTIATINQLKKHFPQAELFWLMGADSLAGLHRWHRIETLVRAVTFLILPRPGYATMPSIPIPDLCLTQLDTPEIAVAATAIREHLAQGHPVSHLLPPAVHDYIVQNNLYQT